MSADVSRHERDVADSHHLFEIGGICIFDMAKDASQHERDVADSHHLFEIGGICIFDMAKDASQHERDVADSHHLFEIGGICIFDMSKDASQHERHITHSDLILDIAGICIFDIQADASQYERDIADSHHFFKIGGICIFDMSADASRHERDIAHHDLILDIAGICIFDMPADVSQHERDHMLNIAGICIFDMSTDDSQHERDVADSDHLFKIGGICIFYMSDASHHERDVADSDHLFKIGSIYIFDMSADASQDERDASDDISISPVDMSRPANEPEIVSEARESVSIPPVASNAASSSALAIQLPSDVKSQPRLSSLIASGLLAVLGGLTIGYALNATGGAIGRKPVLIVGSILHLVGSILMYWFPNDVVASIGLTIIGCSVALLNLVIPIILSEINIGKALKWISFVFNSMVLWGSTSAKAVSMAAYHNFRNGWRWSFASSGFFALPLLLLSFLLSETPRFLIKKRRMEEAKKSIKALRKSGAEAELQMLADLIDNEGRGRRKKLSRSPLLLINIATQIFQHVLGLDSILFFGPFILESAGYSDNSSFVAPLIAGVIRAGVAGLAFPSYSYFGRRRTLVSACLGMVVAHISLLGFFLLVGDPIFPLSQKSAYVGMVFAIPLICFYLIFSGPCEWTEESYSEDIRVLGSCWEMNISLVMSLIMNLAVLLLLCTLKAWIFMLFSALTLGVCFSIYKLLPERKRKKTK